MVKKQNINFDGISYVVVFYSLKNFDSTGVKLL